MNIKENVKRLVIDINECKKKYHIIRNITICAATKYVSVNEMDNLLEEGINNFGENRVDHFLKKYEMLRTKQITWHFIGSLQTNKVKKIINKIDYLHSLDRESLAKEINKTRLEPLNCFVEVNCSFESSKQGISPNEVINFIQSLEKYDKIKVIGLMTMAENTSCEEIIHNTFKRLRLLQIEVQALNLSYAPCTELSMGMSNDYKIAILEGATFIRLGSILFQ